MRTHNPLFRIVCWGLVASMALQSCPALASGGEILDCYRKVHAHFFEQKKPAAVHEHPVESYAKQIDWLEHKIDNYGTVVPKHPDIWGQARLQKHREEFEEQMYGSVDKFTETLQGSISRSDQSFLALSFALNKSSTGPSTTVETGSEGKSASEFIGSPTNPPSGQATKWATLKNDFGPAEILSGADAVSRSKSSLPEPLA